MNDRLSLRTATAEFCLASEFRRSPTVRLLSAYCPLTVRLISVWYPLGISLAIGLTPVLPELKNKQRAGGYLNGITE